MLLQWRGYRCIHYNISSRVIYYGVDCNDIFYGVFKMMLYEKTAITFKKQWLICFKVEM